MSHAISVLMPVWNGCRDNSRTYLDKAIESILSQTFEDFEFVIVDDGSTDGTPAVLAEHAARDPRIRIIRNATNLKISRALNRGIQECRAPLIARQDADDMSTVTRLELQKAFLDARPETAMCGSGMYVINQEGKLETTILHPASPAAVREALTRMCPFVHGSVMYRKAAVEAVGLYSTEPAFDYAEDYELWVRMAAKHVVENIPGKALYFHRNHRTKSSAANALTQDRSTRRIMDKAKELLR